MRVLIACECSGIVRQEFIARGHDAWSCDIKPSEDGGNHIQGNVLSVLYDGWDMMIAHPPCTYFSKAGNRWMHLEGRKEKRELAARFVLELWDAPISSIAIENPIGQLSVMWRRPDQIVCPSDFGHDVTKATCLWLKNLPPLMATLYNPFARKNWAGYVTGKDRQTIRSRTFKGLAQAMASQWG